ncbi:hypothetical protein KUL42_39990 [Alteromonas sp. KUL42]|uniref:alginate export family protein n=1 Tax=Alteromonas sp. KUL42 TaxID=2480797 RepID=UPI00079B80BC|nr:alginate export family protein [Alteromonas sp. KUL42]KXJ59649.1 MAG: hypothetical protein AXW14_05140 [Alteromonas sp. Nap_26]TAP31820.1 hypothetical protein EYR97_19330 [Alteromonas sp. KUL42]GEA09238.1 hypothetical protein KUL42_39990 [Alteromonas sp. KUL42]
MLARSKGKFRGLHVKQLAVLALAFSACIVQADETSFDVSGSYRLRYESLNNPIFPSSAQSRDRTNDRISSRLRVKANMSWDAWGFTAELQDSRVFLDDNDPTLRSSQVNTLEPLQFYTTYTPNDNSVIKSVSLGRMELTYGSRRLISKAVYRNATNTFDGIEIDSNLNDWSVKGIYLLPVSRLPTAQDALDDNERAFDKSFSERRLFGFFAVSPDKALEIQSYWFKEDDADDLNTKNRDLYSLSLDYTTSLFDDWEANVEVIGQVGTSHQTTSASDNVEKDVRAFLFFGYLGRKVFDHTFLRAEIDFFSGDNNSADDTIRDFDGLYGVRRFDIGPTDVYQGMPRRNLKSIGLRSVSKPTKQHNIMAAYKSFWYHRAPEGVDSFIGHQFEVRWRYQVLPSLRLALGGAYLLKGEGFERGDYSDNTTFVFTGALYTF